MSDVKKPRSMTAKWFLQKSNTRAANSAAAFLDQYRTFLTTGALAEKTSPILNKMDTGTLLPTPALQEIKQAVLSHIVEIDSKKLEEIGQEEPAATGTRKNWKATVYDAAGVIQSRIKSNGEEEELVKGFDLSQRASEWADRRLFEGASDWYAIVEHTRLDNVSSRIERADAIARVLKQKKGPTLWQRSKTTKNLSFGVKCSQDRASFSRG